MASPSPQSIHSLGTGNAVQPIHSTPARQRGLRNSKASEIKSTPIASKQSGQAEHVIHKREMRLEQLAGEIAGKIVGPMPAELFLNAYLPDSNVREVEEPCLEDFYTKMEEMCMASKSSEGNMYPKFINAMNNLSSLHFYDTNHKPMEPFQSIVIRPDVCAYTERQIDPEALKDPKRPEIMLEFKVAPGDDPFMDRNQTSGSEAKLLRDTERAKETLGQITSYAAAHQSAQFRSHIFSLLVLPKYCRLLRWDRSGVVVTEKIYLDGPMLPEFFHRYERATPEERGVDTSVSTPSSVHERDARMALELDDAMPVVQISVSPESKGYIIPRETYMDSTRSPLGRSTRAFHAYSIESSSVVFLKDSWRLASQCQEHEVLKIFNEKGVQYVPTAIDGGDILGQRTRTQDLVDENPSWAIRLPKRLRKHHHYRLVLKEVALPLTTFKSTKRLVTYFKQAMIAHAQAHERANILHRDISVNNIMIYKDEALLIDWDLSKSTEGDQSARETERTGTWQFIAARLIQEEVNEPHNLTDDLESFVHLLTWMALRYTDHGLSTGRLTYFIGSTFDHSYRVNGQDAGGDPKISYLKAPDILRLARFKNEYLVRLLESITEAVAARYMTDPFGQHKKNSASIPADMRSFLINSYETKCRNIASSKWMINEFDSILKLEGWPENDSAVVHRLDHHEVSKTENACTGSRRSRETESWTSNKRRKTSVPGASSQA